jgi:hypothetical protein
MAHLAFFDRVAEAKKNLAIGRQGAWFRGVKKSHYELIPSLLRDKTLKGKEHNLIASFRRRGVRYLSTKDRWEQLAFMQHYGVPTKLADWSEDLTSALYFALAFNAKSKNDLNRPHIWILHPFRLNGNAKKKSGKAERPRIIFDSVDPPPPLDAEGMKGTSWPYELPIAIALDWRDSRIEHQQGVFTYHGTDDRPIDKTAPDCVQKVTIDADEIDGLLAYLRNAGVSHHRMLQSPDSLGLDITQRALRFGTLWCEDAAIPTFSGASEEEDEKTVE